MGDRIKGLAVLALVGVAAWQGYHRFRGSNETHRFGFAVEGPQGCQVQLDYGIGDGRRTDVQPMPWEGDAVESHGNPSVVLRSRAPASCALQPEQMRCVITRDGVPWQNVVAHRTTDATNGDPNGILCEVERDANLAPE